jgi:hypothetical protein
MSTPQLGIRIEELEAKRLRIRLFGIADETGLPSHKELDLFVRLLADAEPVMDNPRAKKDRNAEPALVADLAADGGDVFDEPWLADNAARYVKRVKLVERINRETAERASVLGRGRKFKAEEKLRQAVFDVEVKKPAYLAHLRVGDVWESTAYSVMEDPDQEPDVAPRETKPPVTGPALDLEALEDGLAKAGVRVLAKDRVDSLRSVLHVVGDVATVAAAAKRLGVAVDMRTVKKTQWFDLLPEESDKNTRVRILGVDELELTSALVAALSKKGLVGSGFLAFDSGFCTELFFAKGTDLDAVLDVAGTVLDKFRKRASLEEDFRGRWGGILKMRGLDIHLSVVPDSRADKAKAASGLARFR